jgi:hypothetical protein
MALTARQPVVARVSLLDLDRDLGRALGEDQAAAAARELTARVVRVAPGCWHPVAAEAPGPAALGALVIEGLLVREVSRAHSASAELLGPGDVIRPWQRDEDSFVPAEVSWFVPDGARVAILDARLAASLARWPAVAAELFGRLAGRSHSQCLTLALTQVRRLDHRTLLYLWGAGERFGRMTPDGVALRLPFTHERLALLVGAHRPSFTTALRKLERAGLLLRGSDHELVLTPEARETVAELAAPAAAVAA